jgi:acetyl esterase/lipase
VVLVVYLFCVLTQIGTINVQILMKNQKMKIKYLIIIVITIAQIHVVLGQKANPFINLFPQGTIIHGNIPYNNDTLKKHQLDIYLPGNGKGKLPLIILVHGGGWLVNDKYADLGYMKKTIVALVNEGFALASIDYRFASQAIFPALIQDCNRAVSFLYDNADKYGFDKNHFAVIGWSAGGQLASLMGLSKNNNVSNFFMPNSSKSFEFKAVVDFYGPSELILLKSAEDPKSPESILIGDSPINRPDLAKIASPVTYVDKNDPPFLIIHGEKDDMVNPQQSKFLHSWLNVAGVKSELIIVKDAPHYGTMFDADEIRNKVVGFLKNTLKN